MTMKTRQPTTYGTQQKQFKRKVYSDTITPQEARKAMNRQPNSKSKAAGKRRTRHSQSQQKEGDHENQSRDK